MSHNLFTWAFKPIAVAAVSFAAALSLTTGHAQQGQTPSTTVATDPCKDGASADAKLRERIGVKEGTKVSIAPQKPGEENKPQPDGEFKEVKDTSKIFAEIIAASGIKPCETRPKDLADKKPKGFLDFTKDSDVLNKNSERATFGWYIQVQDGETVKEYYVLFSYDYVKVKGEDGKDKILCAMEVFLFGPFTRDGETVKPNPPKLIEGWAVNGDLCLLKEVPENIAKIQNSVNCIREGEIEAEEKLDEKSLEKLKKVDPGTLTEEEKKAIIEARKKKFKERTNGAVQTGVDKDLAGCLVCHEQGEGLAQQTVPFPWYKED